MVCVYDEVSWVTLNSTDTIEVIMGDWSQNLTVFGSCVLVLQFNALSFDEIVVIVSGCVCGLLIRLLWLLSAVAADKLQAGAEYPCWNNSSRNTLVIPWNTLHAPRCTLYIVPQWYEVETGHIEEFKQFSVKYNTIQYRHRVEGATPFHRKDWS